MSWNAVFDVEVEETKMFTVRLFCVKNQVCSVSETYEFNQAKCVFMICSLHDCEWSSSHARSSRKETSHQRATKFRLNRT